MSSSGWRRETTCRGGEERQDAEVEDREHSEVEKRDHSEVEVPTNRIPSTLTRSFLQTWARTCAIVAAAWLQLCPSVCGSRSLQNRFKPVCRLKTTILNTPTNAVTTSTFSPASPGRKRRPSELRVARLLFSLVQRMLLPDQNQPLAGVLVPAAESVFRGAVSTEETPTTRGA